MGGTNDRLRAQIRSASSGRSSKVIKDRERVEVSVDVPDVGRLILSVDSEGRYTLHAGPKGGEAPASTRLAAGKMRTAEHEPD